MRKIWVACLLTAAPLTALNAMTVTEFLAKATAVEKQGMGAFLSSDYRQLDAELSASRQATWAEARAAKAAGHPSLCPPKKAILTDKEFLQYIRTLNPAQRNISVKAAVVQLAKKKWPCPA